MLAAALSVATLLVRLVFPFDGHQIGELQLRQGPQCLALFGLGIVAAQRGGLQPVPDRIRRGCGITTLAGALAFFALRPVDAPAEIKALAVAFGGVAASFALAWSSSRAPGCGASSETRRPSR